MNPLFPTKFFLNDLVYFNFPKSTFILKLLEILLVLKLFMLPGFKTLYKLSLCWKSLLAHTSPHLVLLQVLVYASLPSITCYTTSARSLRFSLCFHSTLNSLPNTPLPHFPALCSTYHTTLIVLNVFLYLDLRRNLMIARILFLCKHLQALPLSCPA